MSVELLNPFTGEIVSDPTIQDAFQIYKQINELETQLKKAKKLAQAFVDATIDEKYICDDDYQFRRVPRTTVLYDLNKLKTVMTPVEILTFAEIDAKALDAFVSTGLKEHTLAGTRAEQIMAARSTEQTTHIRLEKVKFDKKGE